MPRSPVRIPRRRRSVPAVTAPFLSGRRLAAAYRSGELTPTGVTEALLQRIAELDPDLNAFALVLADSALARAEQMQHELAAGVDRGPLHGVPVAIKDLMAVAGAPTGFGSRVGRVERAERDAAVVARLREAGAILVGKTNLLEYAYGAVHPEVGPTRNPHDLGRTAGGSSGGSAAAVAAGLTTLAIGTDTGGSIRIPAAYCGVFGHKPTYGRVPVDGVFPLSWTLDHVGPLARTAGDAADLLVLMADGPEALRQRGTRPDGDTPPLTGLRFGVPRAYVDAVDLEPPVRAALDAAERALAEAGAAVMDAPLGALERANEALLDILYPEASVLHEQYMSSSAEGYAAATRSQLEYGFTVPATRYLRALETRRALTAVSDDLLAGFDALLMPAVNTVAPAEDPVVSGQEGAVEMHFSGPFDLVGAPAVTVPFNARPGLPVGLQLVAARGADARLLELAGALAALAPVTPRPGPPFGPG